MAVVGKYTWLSVPPDSYNTDPSGISTDSRSGSQRCEGEVGRTAVTIMVRSQRSNDLDNRTQTRSW